jgi:hypothetical protein
LCYGDVTPTIWDGTHLLGETAGLGFNRDDPTDDNPFPDAWCDNCELIRASHNGWNDESQKLAKISLLCSGCYERALIRNTRTSVTLDDLAELTFSGSAAAARNGILGPALILVTIHPTTGSMSTKRQAVRPAFCQVGARSAARPS